MRAAAKHRSSMDEYETLMAAEAAPASSAPTVLAMATSDGRVKKRVVVCRDTGASKLDCRSAQMSNLSATREVTDDCLSRAAGNEEGLFSP